MSGGGGGGKCPEGICPWGKCPGGTCPGGYVLEPLNTHLYKSLARIVNLYLFIVLYCIVLHVFVPSSYLNFHLYILSHFFSSLFTYHAILFYNTSSFSINVYMLELKSSLKISRCLGFIG